MLHNITTSLLSNMLYIHISVHNLHYTYEYTQPSWSGKTFNIHNGVSFIETHFPGTYCIQHTSQLQLTCV